MKTKLTILGAAALLIGVSPLNTATIQGATQGPVLKLRLSAMELTWNSQADKMYQVQYSVQPTSNTWVDLGLPIKGNGSLVVTNDLIDPGQQPRSYRVVETSTGTSQGLNLKVRGSEVELTWHSLDNKQYQLQYNIDLAANAWINLGAPIQGSGFISYTYDPIDPGQLRKYYRVIESQ